VRHDVLENQVWGQAVSKTGYFDDVLDEVRDVMWSST
jgi:hypothetical protein